jgi:phosphoenolpyruvate synthase/pyruvate phosphate dikinase
MKIESIKNKDLVYFGERIEPYFASSIIVRGMLDKVNLTKILGWQNGVRWIYTNNYFFIKKSDLDKINTTLLKKNNETYTKKLIKKCFEYGNQLIQTSKDIKKQSDKKYLDKKQMHKLLKKYLSEANNYMIFQNIALFEDMISDLTNKLVKKYSKNKKEYNTLLELITTSNRLTAIEKEKNEFLCLGVKKDSVSINKHVKKYSWLALRFFIGKPWTKELVLQRLKNYTPVKARLELEKIVSSRQTRELQINKVTKNFSKKDKEIVELIRNIVFLRTQRTDFFQESSYYVLPLIKKIATELKITYNDLLYLSASEVLLSLKNKFNYLTCIKKRKKGFLVFFDYNQNIVLESTDALKYIKQRPILKQNLKTTKKISGQTGFLGKATGKVKIIKSAKDNMKVKKGDIVVAIMTTPNFIPALEKAAAFITDEGGITCHAAIIAREMKKPCIIGTKNATKLLKDGDIIKVDADKGIIKIK